MSHFEPKQLFHQINSAQGLNEHCFCQTLNIDRLHQQLELDPSLHAVMANLSQTHPHLFSSSAIFISQKMNQKIQEAIAVIERVIALPQYQDYVYQNAPEIAKHAFGPIGVCMGYDFHLSDHGPKLIEINTNAGGQLLNLALARAQESCCAEMDQAFIPNQKLEGMEQTLLEMFLSEWRLQRGHDSLDFIVIVDDDPQHQYLAPEFELFVSLFKRYGIEAVIADPKNLEWRENHLWINTRKVQMVYNRLTDFYLEEDAHRSLKLAYEAGAIVLTPQPRAHLLYANKRNLIILSSDLLLKEWGVSELDRDILNACVPRTQLVSEDKADQLWSQRKQLFFKPTSGYGAKAAYRGDKVTKKVWEQILSGDFVAQELVPPAQRLIQTHHHLSDLKFDLRAYAYAGNIQLLAARMYAGQTTNFRTEGGGFAPVIVLPDHQLSSLNKT